MKFSYNWLRELVDGLETAPKALGHLITMKTAECEGVVPYAPHLARVAAARVLSVEPLAGSHNVKAEIDAGEYGRRTVVCGASNCRPGVFTVYVPPGTMLGSATIRKLVIDGVESDGLLASAAELGLSRDHSGILELPSQHFDIAPDSIIEIDNKSLTHRPDLWGHHGMAREVAAISGGALRETAALDLIPHGHAQVSIELPEPALCPRYSALVFENVTVQPSPLWMQHRLQAVGLNPINNIVDVTNFVMAELAQPMHAFDADKLSGSTIYARSAKPGERIEALNGEAYDLTPANLVIATDQGPVAIAGVIGGAASAISESTTRIVLESANFDAVSIRKTSSALKLRTDASMRFEKSQDPVNTVRALARAVTLLEQVSPGIRVVGGLADVWHAKPEPPPIRLPLEWLELKLGRRIDNAEVWRILESLEFGVSEPVRNVLSVTVPSWRATKDISIKDDLVEEVGRMIGYGSITPRPPMIAAAVPPSSAERRFYRVIREKAAARGFTEVMNYSFLSEETAARFGGSGSLRVSNPIVAGQDVLRGTLIPGIWKNVLDNSKNFDSFRIFEIGQEIHERGAELPDEAPHLAAAVYTRTGDGQAGLFELDCLLQCLMPGMSVEAGEARTYQHPARTGRVLLQGREVGQLFEFHPELVETGRAAALDVDLRAIFAALPDSVRFVPIRRLPSSTFDLSVITEPRRPVGQVRNELIALAGVDLLAIEFLRVYSGAPLAGNTKSISFRLNVGAPERTLSSEEVGAIRTQIIEGMQSRGYEFRL